MKKIAIFVEGQTEQLFLEKLLIEIAGVSKIKFNKPRIKGNKLIHEGTSEINDGKKYYVLLVDCHGDSKVKSVIVENYNSLVKGGHSAIIGIRDVYPEKRNDIPLLNKFLYYGMKTSPIKPLLLLSIMEIEAWFLAEHTHFEKIDKSLKLSKISKQIGFDPSTDDMELRDHPAKDLDKIYKMAGLDYTKKRENALRTINMLDYERFYLELGSKLPNLGIFIETINSFFS